MESSGHDKNDERLVGNLYMILGYTPRGQSCPQLWHAIILFGRKECTPGLQATNDREQSARRFVLLSHVPQRSRPIGRRSHSSDGLFETVREQERVSRPPEV
jgi:hypothetical protein